MNFPEAWWMYWWFDHQTTKTNWTKSEVNFPEASVFTDGSPHHGVDDIRRSWTSRGGSAAPPSISPHTISLGNVELLASIHIHAGQEVADWDVLAVSVTAGY